jgi:hypothetical protein
MEAPFALRDADPALMACALSHTTCRQAAAEVRPRRPLGSCLTAGQSALVLAHAAPGLHLRTARRQAPSLSGRQRQALRGVVRSAVSDAQDVQASGQPAACAPIGVAPLGLEGWPVAPALLLQAADDRPALVPHPLQEAS